ncbi:MAG: hypothetical protein ACRDMZ_15170, partial [Solirubrobacteraceae bacterium]
MSGEPNQNGEPQDAPAEADGERAEGDVIPVEVVPPSAENDIEARLQSLEKDKKDNWDRYLRAAAD